MTAALALLVASAGISSKSLPDGHTIDTLTYSFGAVLGPGGSLSVAPDGKVRYFYCTEPFTNSGGIVIQKDWELTKGERDVLFRDLVAAGLLDLPEGKVFTHSIRVGSGRWYLVLDADKAPERVTARLRPLLAKAHPQLWPEKPAAAKADKPPALESLRYEFTPKLNGERVILEVRRDGSIAYRRVPQTEEAVSERWTLPGKEAAALLDALATGGLFEAEDAGGGKFPDHFVEAVAGRWRTAFHMKELPAGAMKHLRPLLEKADPGHWKKP